jgi:hypothetical protein
MRIYCSLTHTDVSIGPKRVCFQYAPLTSFSLLTSLDILEKPIAHKRTDKYLAWIQNLVVRPTHKIPRLVNMIHK